MKLYRDSKTGKIYLKQAGKYQLFYDPDAEPKELQDDNADLNGQGLSSDQQDKSEQSDNKLGNNQLGSQANEPGSEKDAKDGDGSGENDQQSNALGDGKQTQQGTHGGDGTSDAKPNLPDKSARISEIKRLLNDEKFVNDLQLGLEPEKIKDKYTHDRSRFTDLTAAEPTHTTLSTKAELLTLIKKKLLAQAYAEEDIKKPTWANLDVKRLQSGAIVKGTTTTKTYKKTKPVLNIYQDVSGSWDSRDRKLGDEVVASLQELHNKGVIEVRHKYFATRVSTEINDCGGSTNGGPVMNDIKSEKPKNVMIITDDDVTNHQNLPTYQLTGDVWFVWKRGLQSDGFKTHLKGKHIYEFNMI